MEMWVRFAHSCLSGPYERELTPDDSDPNVTADDIGEIIGAKCFFCRQTCLFLDLRAYVEIRPISANSWLCDIRCPGLQDANRLLILRFFPGAVVPLPSTLERHALLSGLTGVWELDLFLKNTSPVIKSD